MDTSTHGRPAPERTVVLVLTPAEPLTKVVQVAALAARQQRVPLMIAMLPPHTHVRAPCMAALDTALQVARVTAPHLMVRAHTLSPQDVGARIGSDELVVASPRTWALLPEHVRVAHPPGPFLRLVGPD